MFGLFKKKDPTKKLEKEYDAMLLEARDIQRSGDIKAYAAKMAETEALWTRIEKLRSENAK